MKTNFRTIGVVLFILAALLLVPGKNTWAGSNFQTIPTMDPGTATAIAQLTGVAPENVTPGAGTTIPGSLSPADQTATAVQATLNPSGSGTVTPPGTGPGGTATPAGGLPGTTSTAANGQPGSPSHTPTPSSTGQASDPSSLTWWILGLILLVIFVFFGIRLVRMPKK